MGFLGVFFLRDLAVGFFHRGFNCSQCILKAAMVRYDIPASSQSLRMLGAVSSGFGIGGICSVLVAGVMVFSLLFDERRAKALRLLLFDAFSAEFGSLNCGSLVALREGRGGCDVFVGAGATLIAELVDAEL